jgi:hypothetical protein
VNHSVVIDAGQVPQLGMRRGLNPSQLLRKGLDALLSRQWICHCFEAGKGTRPARPV